MCDILTIKDASLWASRYVGKNISPSNISYLLQYGKISKINKDNNTRVHKDDLQNYYDAIAHTEITWKRELGEDLNWHLSFAEYKESEITKHVHRLHPYKGKFIPQLVEYFLDSHIDEFKQQSFFKKDDIILDPFCGSGTVLVQANELSMHALGIDVSAFNACISNVKMAHCDVEKLTGIIENINDQLQSHIAKSTVHAFDSELNNALKDFNMRHFPSPEFRRSLQRGTVNEKSYGIEKAKEFKRSYDRLVYKYKIPLLQEKNEQFIDRWFLVPIRSEIECISQHIAALPTSDSKKILTLILSRTMRSCRATTHADLGTLRNPVTSPYYCKKHGKICKPLFTSQYWWRRYCQDTVTRFRTFAALRTPTLQVCLTGDSRNIDIAGTVQKKNPQLAKKYPNKKSPAYSQVLPMWGS